MLYRQSASKKTVDAGSSLGIDGGRQRALEEPPANEVRGRNMSRIWVEVDDFVRYFDGSATPTGIGRVQAQILPSLQRSFSDRVTFCRLGSESRDIELLGYEKIARLTDGNAFLAKHAGIKTLLPAIRLQHFLQRRASAAVRRLRCRYDAQTFAATVRPGDTVLNIGASWTHKNFGKTIAELKRTHGLRFAVLIHDILPVSHPHFVAPGHIPNFTHWLDEMSQVWDLVLTPSKSSAASLTSYLTAKGVSAPPMQVVPFGAGFPAEEDVAQVRPTSDGRYVLYVSTIEIRKNHLLLVRVWERLIREHGPDAVPDLVFAGKYGWEIHELRQALGSSGFLGSKVRVVENLSDNELANLYRGSLFTAFPSFCEGWGLPVAESLYYGRYCIASNATSIPEVGGVFVGYHDPDDVNGAYRLFEQAITDADFLTQKEALIRDEFTAPQWHGAAQAIVAAIDGAGRPPLRREHAAVPAIA